MPHIPSIGVKRKTLWLASAAGAGAILADWTRFQRDGPESSLLWRHMVSPDWSSRYGHCDGHTRSVYHRFFGEPPVAVAEAEENKAAWGPWKFCPFRDGGCGSEDGLPKDLRTRFMRYALPDAKTGEWVLCLHDFIRCMLLLKPDEESGPPLRGPPFARARQQAERIKERQSKAKDDTSAMDALPPHVQRRLKGIFKSIDLDKNGTVNYAEFVVLFTMLSTRRRTFKAAFELLDDDDNMAVNEWEFTRLMNTLMVDPAVQLVYDGVTAGHSPTTTDTQPSPASKAARHGESKSVSAADVRPDAARIKSRRIRQASRDDSFSYHIPSSLVMNLITSPVPRHLEPPPGSTHYSGEKKAYLRQLESMLARDNRAGLISYDTFWYRMDFLRWELRAIEFGTFDQRNTGFITLRDFRSILSYDARRRVLPTSERAVDAGTPSTRTPEPARDTGAGAGGGSVGFWNFGRRYASEEDYVKQKGTHRDITSKLRADALDDAIGHIGEDEKVVSWQFYQTVFDVIRESDRTLPALTVALRSLPPTLPEDLVAGAIPDGETKQRSDEVKDLVAQKVGAETDAERSKIRRTQAELIRPTALTWSQFGRVLGAIDGIPKLTEKDQRLFFALFDADRSGTITPEEFAQLCELKRSFFALTLPRFSEPRRNAVQKFVFCMQQLE